MEHQKNRENLIIGILLAGLFIGLVYVSRHVILPFFIAFSLAYLLDPLVDKMETWNLSRTVSVVFLLLVFFSLCLGGWLLLFPLLEFQAKALAKNIPGYIDILEERARPVLQFFMGMDEEQVKALVKERFSQLGELPLKIFGATTKFVWDSVSGLFSVLVLIANLIIIPVAMFYLLRDFDRINEKLLNLVPPRHREKTVAIVHDVDRALASFVRGQMMVALLMGVLYSIGLFFCQTPMSLFIGLVAGLANLVPYLGVIVGFVPAALLTYLQTQDWTLVAGVVAVFVAVQALEGMIFSPRILGDNIGLHPVVVIFAVLLGGELFGFLGIMLAVPAVAVLNVLLRRGVIEYKKSGFFSS